MLKSPHSLVNALQAVAQLLSEVRVFLDEAIARQEDRIQEELAARQGEEVVVAAPAQGPG